MKLRVVFHTPSLRGGGAERVFALMANAMAARGHQVTLFTWNADGPNLALLSDQVQLVSLDMPIRGEGFGKAATLRGIWKSARYFRWTKPDAVFSAPEFANLTTALALMLSRSRARFFPTYHAANSLPSSSLGARIAIALSRIVAQRATRAVAVSAGVGRDLVARGLPESKIAVVHNPLPPAQPAKRDYPWHAAAQAMGDGPLIVTAGRLVQVKDHKTLLDAFARLASRRAARLAIFGEGPLESELRAYADQLGVSKRVLFPGYVNEPAAIYQAADLFVLTSTSEGFGNVLIEAMAHGVAVVSTNAPHGPREILADGRYGALVPVGDADALAAAIAETLDRPPPRELLMSRASDFSVETIAAQYEALLR